MCKPSDIADRLANLLIAVHRDHVHDMTVARSKVPSGKQSKSAASNTPDWFCLAAKSSAGVLMNSGHAAPQAAV
jgi:hypothetical protein